MPCYDLLVAGEINPDLILNGRFSLEFGQAEELVDSAHLTIGSSSAIFACGAARLGLKTVFTGVCGDDLNGHFMLEQMQQRQVDPKYVRIVSGGATGLSVILNRGEDRMILTYPGLINTLKAEDVTNEILQTARHLHVAGYFIQDALRPGLPDLFRRAHRLGLTTSLDTNYDPSEQWLGLRDLLAQTDIFFPNEKEALLITHQTDPQAALADLAGMCRVVVMKCGQAGARLAHQGQVFSTSSIAVQVIDTVGAGDSFDAGFIYAFLNGWEMSKALKLAAVCGSLSTQVSGGTTGQATLPEAMRFLEA
jgi:sugar/nucleoside kinase (ribokinase family)